MLEELEQIILKFFPEDLVEHREAKETVATLKELPKLDEFDFEYALNILRDEELLINILRDFGISLKALEGKLENMYEAISNPDVLHEYRIEVHGLKSSAASVGAMLLSKVARLQELAVIDKDYDSIRAIHPLLINQIKKHRDRIMSLFPAVSEEKKATMDKDFLVMLEMALKNNDMDTADGMCIEMMRYKYNEELQKLVEKLASEILQLDNDKALETILMIREL
jgi:HPt (histidine-containing phosphotransfer) domain-containing protein